MPSSVMSHPQYIRTYNRISVNLKRYAVRDQPNCHRESATSAVVFLVLSRARWSPMALLKTVWAKRIQYFFRRTYNYIAKYREIDSTSYSFHRYRSHWAATETDPVFVSILARNSFTKEITNFLNDGTRGRRGKSIFKRILKNLESVRKILKF